MTNEPDIVEMDRIPVHRMDRVNARLAEGWRCLGIVTDAWWQRLEEPGTPVGFTRRVAYAVLGRPADLERSQGS